ncbi:MAG: tetratricopeptide repeat protein [Chlamydiota bacterium]
MTTTHWDDTPRSANLEFDERFFTDQVRKLCDPALDRFDQIVRSYVIFNIIFLGAALLELLLFIIFATTLVKSSLLAMSLATLFVTVSAYFIMRLYLQTRKPEQLIALRNQYIDACKKVINYQSGVAEHHMAIAHAASKLAGHLNRRQYSYYTPPRWLENLGPALETFSCWCHWEDIHFMQENLLKLAIEEHLDVVKLEPTNLEIHASLANSYVMLSSLYIDPRKVEGYDEDRWIPPQRLSEAMQENFRDIAQQAIEEFKILDEYSPNDPWTHAQLAYSYHDLQRPQEEIKEYETILQLVPDDTETLFKLGVLYFQQGMNAKGLRIYEDLKGMHYERSEQLIQFYGAGESPHPPTERYHYIQ